MTKITKDRNKLNLFSRKRIKPQILGNIEVLITKTVKSKSRWWETFEWGEQSTEAKQMVE